MRCLLLLVPAATLLVVPFSPLALPPPPLVQALLVPLVVLLYVDALNDVDLFKKSRFDAKYDLNRLMRRLSRRHVSVLPARASQIE